jgi:RecA-family ATPase
VLWKSDQAKRRGEGDYTVTVWKGKHNVNILANMHILKQRAISVMVMKNSKARNAIL